MQNGGDNENESSINYTLVGVGLVLFLVAVGLYMIPTPPYSMTASGISYVGTALFFSGFTGFGPGIAIATVVAFTIGAWTMGMPAQVTRLFEV